MSWGLFCDNQFSTTDDLAWAEYSVNCQLQVPSVISQYLTFKCVKTTSISERSKRLVSMSRVFWLLGYDDESERLAKAFERNVEFLPLWTWIQWIPQLLAGLSRPEAPQMRNILTKLAGTYPQSLYFQIRSYLAEKSNQRPESSPMDSSSGLLPPSKKPQATLLPGNKRNT